jgi:hypothetical protein
VTPLELALRSLGRMLRSERAPRIAPEDTP